MSKRKLSSISSSPESILEPTLEPSSKRSRVSLPKEQVWVSATQLYNYCNKDPLVDWLKNYPYKLSGSARTPVPTSSPTFSPIKQVTFQSFIMQQGKEFEKYVIEFLATKVPIVRIDPYYSTEGVEKTILEMNRGTPVIYSAPLKNDSNRTYGIADLLVRSDYLGKIVTENPYTPAEAKKGCKLSPKYHYVVIDIKFSTLPLRADGVHILNQDSYPCYKAQLYVYNRAIGIIQGYVPKKSFILGRRWKYTSCGITHSSLECDEKLGTIDFSGIDSETKDMVDSAVKWYRDVLTKGSTWNVFPKPTRKELYPNMCRKSGWDQQKKYIADRLGEITNLWYCGVVQRDLAFQKKIFTWKNKKFSGKSVGFHGKREKVLNLMLKVNRENIGDGMLPKKIDHPLLKTYENLPEYFVDFETISDVFSDFGEIPSSTKSEFLYMIGVLYKKIEPIEPTVEEIPNGLLHVGNSEWEYKVFVADSLETESELKIMKDFFDFVGTNSRLIHWSHAEPLIWSRASERHPEEDFALQWNDLCRVFQDTPIVLKGCFDFSLKNVTSSMRKLKMIKTRWTSETQNGLDAMVNAYNAYRRTSDDILSDPTIQDIIEYNRFDCEAIAEILTYLRTRF